MLKEHKSGLELDEAIKACIKENKPISKRPSNVYRGIFRLLKKDGLIDILTVVKSK